MRLILKQCQVIHNHKFFCWLYYDCRKGRYFNLTLGLFVLFFLGVTQPFGIQSVTLLDNLVLLLILLPIALGWILVPYLANFVILRFYPETTRQPLRNLYVWVGIVVIIVHLTLLIRQLGCDWQCIDLREYLQVWTASLFVFILVYLPFSLYGRYRYYHSIVGQGHNSGQSLHELRGEGKEKVQVDLSLLIFLKADDNYVDLMLKAADGTLVKKSLRTTLKALEAQLKEQSQFIRTHRSYMINLQYLSGELRGSSVVLLVEDQSLEIPVSRKYRPGIKQLID